MAKIPVLFFSFIVMVRGIVYDGLRVKFGFSHVDDYYKLPRTRRDALSEGWQRTDRPEGPMPELTLYCPPGAGGRILCLLYNMDGFVSGLQVALPVHDVGHSVQLRMNPEDKFVKWNAPAFAGQPARQYWTATQYFMTAGTAMNHSETLQNDGVWVMGLDRKWLRIPTTELELEKESFKRQNCIQHMGTHYFYNFTREMKCDRLLPWFALTAFGELVGTGFQTIGKLPNPSLRSVFEKMPIDKKTLRLVMPTAPHCFMKWVGTHGFLSLHIYYINEPWKIRCMGPYHRLGGAVDTIIDSGVQWVHHVKSTVRSFKSWFLSYFN